MPQQSFAFLASSDARKYARTLRALSPLPGLTVLRQMKATVFKPLQSEAVAKHSDPSGWRQEGKDVIRGVAAGAIVGVPLLYTMEMWWHGMTFDPQHMLLLLGVVLLINFCFSFLSGFREEYSIGEAISESITSVGIGLVFSLVILVLIGEVTFDAVWSDIVGRVLIETLAVSIGVMFANSQLRQKSREGNDQNQEQGGSSNQASQEKSPQDPNRAQLREDLNDVAATLVGATILSLSVAPTEEILLIATRLAAWQLLLLAAASLLLCYLILFAAGFKKRTVYVKSMFQNPLAETVMAYGLSLLVALGLLYLVGMDETTSDLRITIASTVTLGLPATVGGAAGRLII